MNDDCNNNKNTIDHLNEVYENFKASSPGISSCSDLYLPGWPPCNDDGKTKWLWLASSEPIEIPERPKLGKKYTFQMQIQVDQIEEAKEFLRECKGAFFASFGDEDTRMESSATGELDEENATLTITWESKDETNE